MRPRSIFTWREFADAKALATPWFVDSKAAGWHRLDHLPVLHRCCYLIVDEVGALLYIGKVDRTTTSGLPARLGYHHARHDGWYAAWVVPLDPGASTSVVARTERVLIAVFDPPENRQLRLPRPA